MKTETPPRLPEVGEYVRMLGELVEIQDVTPPPPPKQVDYIFREIHCQAEGRINGKTVIELSCFNTFAGRDDCLRSAVREAEEKQKELGPSDMEFVVVMTTSYSRMRPCNPAREYLYQREFVDFKHTDSPRRGLPPDQTEDVWSSKTGYKEKQPDATPRNTNRRGNS